MKYASKSCKLRGQIDPEYRSLRGSIHITKEKLLFFDAAIDNMTLHTKNITMISFNIAFGMDDLQRFIMHEKKKAENQQQEKEDTKQEPEQEQEISEQEQKEEMPEQELKQEDPSDNVPSVSKQPETSNPIEETEPKSDLTPTNDSTHNSKETSPERDSSTSMEQTDCNTKAYGIAVDYAYFASVLLYTMQCAKCSELNPIFNVPDFAEIIKKTLLLAETVMDETKKAKRPWAALPQKSAMIDLSKFSSKKEFIPCKCPINLNKKLNLPKVKSAVKLEPALFLFAKKPKSGPTF